MENSKPETPRQLLNRKIEEYQSRLELLKVIVDSAQETEGGYIIPPEVLAAVKRSIAA